jgi:hypothetical protein
MEAVDLAKLRAFVEAPGEPEDATLLRAGILRFLMLSVHERERLAREQPALHAGLMHATLDRGLGFRVTT